MKKRWHLIICTAVLLSAFLFVGCNVPPVKDASDSINIKRENVSENGYADGYNVAKTAPDAYAPIPIKEYMDLDFKRIIQNAEYNIEVEKIEEKIRSIEDEVLEKGGFVGESNIYNEGQSRYWANLVIRVPQESFDAMLEYLDDIGRVKERRIYMDDVTTQFIDLEARLKVLKAEEASLLEILADARKVEDVLNVRRELRSVRADIEAMEGELKYLTNRVDFSTIRIHLQQVVNLESGIDATGFSGLWERGSSAFIKNINAMLNLFANAIVVFIGALPIFIPIAVFLGIVFALVYKKNRNAGMQKKKQ